VGQVDSLLQGYPVLMTIRIYQYFDLNIHILLRLTGFYLGKHCSIW